MTEHSPGPSVGRSVCLCAKCIVAKRLSRSECRFGGEEGRSWDRCIRWVVILLLRGSYGGEFGASLCKQWGLCDAALPKLLWTGLVLNIANTLFVILMNKTKMTRTNTLSTTPTVPMMM